jgi:intracellular sulfur oxidation DsrE/DsrF family protein
MNMRTKTIIKCVIISLCLMYVTAGSVYGEEYKALSGSKSVKAVFDFRVGNPKSAVMHLDLIYQTFKDKSIQEIGGKPEFVVVFIGPSVKLVSSSTEGFSPEEKKTIDDISRMVSEMTKDGIRFELCLFAAKFFKVDPATVLPEVNRVGNGWISLIGYQSKGYSIVPAY